MPIWRISVAHVRGHDDRHGRLATELLALALEREAHGVGVRRTAHQRLEDGILQCRGAVAFEQPRQGPAACGGRCSPARRP